MGDAATVQERILFGDLVVGAIAIALDHPVRAFKEPRGHLARTTGIVIKEDDPLARGTGDSHPHPVLRACRLLTVDDLHRRLIDADIAAALQPLIHEVDERLDPLPERDNPGGLRQPFLEPARSVRRSSPGDTAAGHRRTCW